MKKKVPSAIKKAERKGTIVQSNRGDSSPHSVSNDEGSTSNRGQVESISEMRLFMDDSFRRHNDELRVEFKGIIKESETAIQTKLQAIQYKNEEFMKQIGKLFNDMENANKQRFESLNKKFDSLMQIGDLTRVVPTAPVLQSETSKTQSVIPNITVVKPEVPPSVEVTESPKQERNHKIVNLSDQSTGKQKCKKQEQIGLDSRSDNFNSKK